MTAPLCDRLPVAVEEARAAFIKLLGLADELRDAGTRGLGIVERLQRDVTTGLDAPGVVRLPRGIAPNGGGGE